ncbi:MAG TPA: hypothetical protein VJH22_04835, partial [Candidatus Nanoarchaeia archaeon]|nr:hypothetical protein [Candidatus Nanoarchaeia archaeon]
MSSQEVEQRFGLKLQDEQGMIVKMGGGRMVYLDQEMTVVIDKDGRVKDSFFGRLDKEEIADIAPGDTIQYASAIEFKGIGMTGLQAVVVVKGQDLTESEFEEFFERTAEEHGYSEADKQALMGKIEAEKPFGKGVWLIPGTAAQRKHYVIKRETSEGLKYEIFEYQNTGELKGEPGMFIDYMFQAGSEEQPGLSDYSGEHQAYINQRDLYTAGAQLTVMTLQRPLAFDSHRDPGAGLGGRYKNAITFRATLGDRKRTDVVDYAITKSKTYNDITRDFAWEMVDDELPAMRLMFENLGKNTRAFLDADYVFFGEMRAGKDIDLQGRVADFAEFIKLNRDHFMSQLDPSLTTEEKELRWTGHKDQRKKYLVNKWMMYLFTVHLAHSKQFNQIPGKVSDSAYFREFFNNMFDDDQEAVETVLGRIREMESRQKSLQPQDYIREVTDIVYDHWDQVHLKISSTQKLPAGPAMIIPVSPAGDVNERIRRASDAITALTDRARRPKETAGSLLTGCITGCLSPAMTTQWLDEIDTYKTTDPDRALDELANLKKSLKDIELPEKDPYYGIIDEIEEQIREIKRLQEESLPSATEKMAIEDLRQQAMDVARLAPASPLVSRVIADISREPGKKQRELSPSTSKTVKSRVKDLEGLTLISRGRSQELREKIGDLESRIEVEPTSIKANELTNELNYALSEAFVYTQLERETKPRLKPGASFDEVGDILAKYHREKIPREEARSKLEALLDESEDVDEVVRKTIRPVTYVNTDFPHPVAIKKIYGQTFITALMEGENMRFVLSSQALTQLKAMRDQKVFDSDGRLIEENARRFLTSIIERNTPKASQIKAKVNEALRVWKEFLETKNTQLADTLLTFGLSPYAADGDMNELELIERMDDTYGIEESNIEGLAAVLDRLKSETIDEVVVELEAPGASRRFAKAVDAMRSGTLIR